jgi:hypothetical protein
MSCYDETVVRAKAEECESLFNSDCISEAYDLLALIEETSSTEELMFLSERPGLQEIRRTGAEIRHLLNLLDGVGEGGGGCWTKKNGSTFGSVPVDGGGGGEVGGGVKVIKEANGAYYFLFEGRIEGVEPIHIVAAFVESDLYTQWLPACTESSEIERVSPLKRIIRTQFDFTFLKREALLLGYGDTLKDGSLFILLKGIEGEDDARFPVADCIRVEIEGGFQVREEDVEACSGTMSCSMQKLTRKEGGMQAAAASEGGRGVLPSEIEMTKLEGKRARAVHVRAAFRCNPKIIFLPKWM